MQKLSLGLWGLLAAGALSASACDIHGTPVLWTAEASAPLAAGVHGQYSEYKKDNGDFTSASLQALLNGRFGERWGWQIGVPYVDRTLGDESESGLGDATALLMYRAWTATGEDRSGSIDVYGGVKLPTGDSDRLAEEGGDVHAADERHAGAFGRLIGHAGHVHEEAEVHDEADASADPHAGGHHLALGSGSWDAIAGVRGNLKAGRWGYTFDAQYTFRTEGDYNYQFGNEALVRAGAGYYVRESIWAGAELSGEWRDKDELHGVAQEGSDKKAVYAGPAVRMGFGKALAVSAAIDVPIANRDDNLSGSADFRARASAAFSF